MTIRAAVETRTAPSPLHQWIETLLMMILLASWGDWLLWGYLPGLSFVVFLAGISIAHLLASRGKVSAKEFRSGLVFLLLGLLPAVGTLNSLTVLIAIAGSLAACLSFRGMRPANWSAWIDEFVTQSLMAPFRLPFFFRQMPKAPIDSNLVVAAQGWIVPLILACVFVGLFAYANPVWEVWIDAIDLWALLDIIFSPRAVFWGAVVWFAWPFIEHWRVKRGLFAGMVWPLFIVLKPAGSRDVAKDTVFFERCLVLFNGVFAVQTVLDMTYLWGGAALPDGLTYAGYAHRGAYPLVAAALLAAVFVLVAMRPGGAGEASPKVKHLVLVWLGQNAVLVLSSMFRLHLYVEVYALTYWRFAAFIWMVLVVAGLILIVVRFIKSETGGWLVSANVAVVTLVLYGTSFLNLPGIITFHNLSNFIQVHESAVRIDWRYLERLGPAAYPALLDVRRELSSAPLGPTAISQLERLEKKWARQIDVSHKRNWRSWSFRHQRSYWALRDRQNQSVGKSDTEREKFAP